MDGVMLMRFVRTVAFLLLTSSAAMCAVTVMEGTLTLPTHTEGLPDSTPPFDLFLSSNFFYPYTVRTNFPDQVVNHAWRALTIENEYLKCTVLPDLGGHLYNCLDKLSGRQMFYANPAVKKRWIAQRGAWVAMGIEFNFPVAHSWVTVSPVDFATSQNAHGSASIWIGSVDRVYGMQWRVEFVLRPGSAALEQRVALYNRSDVRRRYSWWADAAVQLDDPATKFIFPTSLVASHASTNIDTWPVSSAGVDLSVVGNQIGDGLGLFAFGTNEPFLGAYVPSARGGVAHFSEVADLPGKKVWTWQSNGNLYARAQLSDNNTTYIEVQAGAFINQETFDYLAPQQTRRFTEYWMPVRGLGGISRANQHAVLNLRRAVDAASAPGLLVEMNVNHAIPGAVVRLFSGDQVILEETADLDPSVTYTRQVSGADATARYTLQLVDASGAALLEHTEGPYDVITAANYPIGPQGQIDWSVQRTESDYIDVSDHDELQGNLGYSYGGVNKFAYGDYARGLQAFPASLPLQKGAARLSVILNRYPEAIDRLATAQAKAPDDPEIHYYLGLARAGAGDDAKARVEFNAILADPQFGAAAGLQLAYLLSRSGEKASALDAVRGALSKNPDMIRAGAVELVLLRKLERRDEAADRLASWRAADPTDSLLLYEQFAQGAAVDPLWRRLAADSDRVLDVAEHFMRLGMFPDALQTLDRRYAAVDPLEAEPGAALPQDDPLVNYYRGYCRERMGDSGVNDYKAASALSTRYVFPSRPASLAVLQAALSKNPADATAHSLLGSLYFSFRMVDEAIGEWQKARAPRPDLPALARNLGRALLELKKDIPGAITVLQEGLKVDPANQEIQSALQTALAQMKK
jgi:tetratricopeptide (TPR) repeat protein